MSVSAVYHIQVTNYFLLAYASRCGLFARGLEGDLYL